MRKVVRSDRLYYRLITVLPCGGNLDPHGAVPGKEDRDPSKPPYLTAQETTPMVSLQLGKMS